MCLIECKRIHFELQGCQLGYTGLPDSSFFMIFLTYFQHLQQLNPNKCKSWYKYFVFFINYISQQLLACIWSNRVANLRLQGCQIPHFAMILCIYFVTVPHFDPPGGQKRVEIDFFLFFLKDDTLSLKNHLSEKKIRDRGQNV